MYFSFLLRQTEAILIDFFDNKINTAKYVNQMLRYHYSIVSKQNST